MHYMWSKQSMAFFRTYVDLVAQISFYQSHTCEGMTRTLLPILIRKAFFQTDSARDLRHHKIIIGCFLKISLSCRASSSLNPRTVSSFHFGIIALVLHLRYKNNIGFFVGVVFIDL